ncbi:hypothetical protein [Bowmanella sp. JS7-9]|uniref:Uncharacterized protein n=1 Tax=Pseudobowmanella zhangzhouensis TaxID=1537679 RepID=A0ABW1XNR4_9ALTE|nr:hypothetical protein [Bowmanella sp. JS7-9]
MHDVHAADCPCPGIEDWYIYDRSPYDQFSVEELTEIILDMAQTDVIDNEFFMEISPLLVGTFGDAF